MPDKPLTLVIPEPEVGGDCSSGCPVYVWSPSGDDTCGAKLHVKIDHSKYPHPGPECPQYKGDLNARQRPRN